MKLTDTHCHLDLDRFDEDRDAVLSRAVQAGVHKILVPALDWDSCLAVTQLAASNPMLFAAVGYHPTDADKWESQSYDRLAELAQSDPHRDRIVAIGEIGLDYYWVKEPARRAVQRRVLGDQLRLARQLQKPAVIHMREQDDAWFGEASQDLLTLLEGWSEELRSAGHPLAGRPGVLHSFNGTLETAMRAVALNFLIGVTGPVTYKNAAQKRQVIKDIPLDHILVETDAPFLAPVPHRGGRNEPAYIPRIADKIAEIHSKDPAEIAEITTANAARLFAWGD
jgi:TatD DNase family protein